jgi:hypothetical protein
MGKHKYIETPEAMWELFEAYKKETKANRRRVPKATPKGILYEEHEPPLTMVGFSSYVADQEITSNIHDYFANTRDSYSEYSSICSRIVDAIKRDQIEGGMVGQYNASITQRLNNLTERVDQTTQGEKVTEIKVNIIPPNDD